MGLFNRVFSILCSFVLAMFLSSCVKDSSKKDPSSSSPTQTVNYLKAVNITPAAFPEDTQSQITLSYTDEKSRLALSCSLNSLSGVTIATACACDGAGVCRVTVKGATDFSGAASFRFNVAIGGEVSTTGSASFSITAIDDAPVTTNISPASFKYNTQSLITLSYSDADGDKATVCSVGSLSNVTVTQACACAAGVCKVGVTGTSNFIGSASFAYTVTANAVVSNSSTASFSIVGDPPVASNITPASFTTNTQSIITLSYTDVQNDQANSCSLTGLTNVFISQACSCAAGFCTVGIRSNPNYVGAARFNYTVTAAGQTSNSATATFSITASTPVSANITPPAFNEDLQSIITLSYTDPLSRKASACSVAALSHISVTQACACDLAGVCTVGVKGALNYNGAASFTYNITAGGQTSNNATATLTINAVDDAPVVATALLTDLIYEDTQSSSITLNYTDVDGDRAGVSDCTITNPTNLTVTSACSCDVILGTCSLKITGNLHYSGTASFDYQIKTTTLNSNVATANLTITHIDHAPVSTNVTPAAFNEDTQSIITLSYSDIDNDLATSCALTSTGNVSVTRACACDGAGVCTVGVTGTTNYNGAANFYYTVTANGVASNISTASFTINNVDDAPAATAITPASFDENTQSIITLSYSDVDSDKASSCTLSSLTNVTVTQACACDGAGVCTVGVTGTLNYAGAAGFNYTVTSNSLTSNSASASFTINTVNTAPTIAAIAASYGNMNTAYVVNFTINDINGPLACSGSVTATSSNIVLIPVANIVFGGTYPNCTATITPTNNNYGSSSINFKVTDAEGAFNSTSFIHTVRQAVTHTWLLGDTGDTNTYSFSSANIESVSPGIIQLAPLLVDQIDNDNSGTGFTSLPSTLKWDTINLKVMQNHSVGAWTLSLGVYSTTYTSRVMDAKQSVAWNSFAWKTPLAFGKELPLTNESAANYSSTSGAFATSLVGLWHFNEITGATTVTNSKTGTADSFLVNSTAASAGVAGKFSSALTFNGGSVIKSATSSAVTPGSFSVSTWLKKTTSPSEGIICFWTTSNTTSATDCPVRASSTLRVRVGGTNYGASTTINDGLWHHIVVISDSSAGTTKAYIDGVLESITGSPPNFTAASTAVYLGSTIGNTGEFNGTLDETAIWNRVLTSSEATELYRRGVNRIKNFYRTCTDNTCSTNPAWSASLSELDNVSSGEALATAPSFVIAPANQRFFQYKSTFESDVVPTTSAPELFSVTVGPVHYSYSTADEAFVTQEGLSFKTLSAFTETLGTQGCSGSGGGVRYQLSKDKVSWSYYNGTSWGAGSAFASSSTKTQLQNGLATYTSSSNTSSDTVYIRGFLKSDVNGATPCEVDQLKLDGNE
jgi:hypothetical protein